MTHAYGNLSNVDLETLNRTLEIAANNTYMNIATEAELSAQLFRLTCTASPPLPPPGSVIPNHLNTGLLLPAAAHQSLLNLAALAIPSNMMGTSGLLSAVSPYSYLSLFPNGLLANNYRMSGPQITGFGNLAMLSAVSNGQMQPGLGSSMLGLDVLSRLNQSFSAQRQ